MIHKHTEKFAKLLAAEDIFVDVKPNVQTASFDTKNRVLTLPLWDNLQLEEDEMMVAHEVGHALYTPNDKWTNAIMSRTKNKKVYASALCIVEDARIERNIKNKFPGLKHTFRTGYEQLWNRPLFQNAVKLFDPDDMIILDQLNMHYKFGDEKFKFKKHPRFDEFVSLMDNMQTFDEVIDITNKLYDICEEDFDEEEQGESEGEGEEGEGDGEPSDSKGKSGKGKGKGKSSDSDSDSDNDSDGDGDGDSDDDDDNDDESESENQGQGSQKKEDKEDKKDKKDSDGDGESEEKKGKSETKPEEKEVQGKENKSKKQHDGQKDRPSGSSKPATGKKAQTEPLKFEKKYESKTQEQLGKTINETVVTDDFTSVHMPEASLEHIIVPYTEVMNSIRNNNTKSSRTDNLTSRAMFYSNNKDTIAYALQQFEIKKKASDYERTVEFKTGTLDTSRLAFYKTDENLFLSAEEVKKGKNHSLMFIVDFSGSMDSTIHSVLLKLLEITLFAKAAGIPFRAYGFSDDRNGVNYLARTKNGQQFKNIFGKNPYGQQFSLIEFLSSNMSTREFDEMTASILNKKYTNSGYFNMNGTPLVMAINCLDALIDKFRGESPNEITNVVFLTDGGDCTYGIFDCVDGGGIEDCIMYDDKLKTSMKFSTLQKKFHAEKITYNGTSRMAHNIPLERAAFMLHMQQHRLKAKGVNVLNYFLTYGQHFDPNSLKKTATEKIKNEFYLIEPPEKSYSFDKFFTLNCEAFNLKQQIKAAIDKDDVSTVQQAGNQFINANRLRREEQSVINAFMDTIA